MRRNFIVKLDVPQEATVDDCLDYIKDAVQTYRGSLRPPGAYDDNDAGDSMWDLNTDTIEVVKASQSIHNTKVE